MCKARAILLVTLASALILSCSASLADTPQRPRLKASAGFNDLFSVVFADNKDSFAWRGCRVVINEKYELKIGDVKAGGSFIEPLKDFADRNGNRFDPYHMKAQKLWILCENGEWYGMAEK